MASGAHDLRRALNKNVSCFDGLGVVEESLDEKRDGGRGWLLWLAGQSMIGASTIDPGQVARSRPRLAPILRAASIRHVAIVVAAILAWKMTRPSDFHPLALGVLGAAATVNVAMVVLAERLPDRLSAAVGARWLSLSVGAATWATLVGLTGGVGSPMVAGFWLEIAISSIVLRSLQIVVVACAAVAALWAQQSFLGLGNALEPLCVETAFLLVMGALTYYVSERFAHKEETLRADADDLSRRLRRLERQLQEAQAVGRVGERVARLAHAAKGAVHSLRGFTKLIEAPLLEIPAHRRALEGLRLAIDRLEEIARMTLRPSVCESGEHGTSAARLVRTLEEVIEEVRPRYAGVRLITRAGDGPRGVSLPASELREVLLALVQNAAEASGTSGEIAIELEVHASMLRILVRDRGPGLSPSVRQTLFEPGATTKPTGSGFGLFLARRLVESGGGQLTVESPPDGGALFAVSLPIQEG